MIGILVTALVVVVLAVIIVKLLANAGINGTVSMIVYGVAAIIILLLLLQLLGVVHWWPGYARVA